MGGHERDARNAAGRMAASPSPLQKPGDALWRADLDHALDGKKIHAEIEAGRADNGFQRPVLEPLLHPVARLARQRAVMDRQDSGPFRPQAKNMLIPELRLGACVGENEGGRRGFDLGHDGLDHFRAEMARPGKALRRLRQQRVDDQRLVEPSFDQRASRRVAWPEKHAACLVEIAERRRQAPGYEARAEMTKARQRKLGLHAALVADKLVPLVDDDEGERRERLPRALLGQHEREAFWRRHEKTRRLSRQRRALTSRRVAGAGADPPQTRT